MLQHDNAQPHIARICTQFLEAEYMASILTGHVTIEHVWDALDRRI
uniref:Uncharacterized protein n=1 Tax=Cyprinus carpio TaxID=7962 RepID=A0A8C2K8F6_CYPCA